MDSAESNSAFRSRTNREPPEPQRAAPIVGEDTMSRNRKHQTAAVRFGPALKALALCLFMGGSGVGYVWQKEQINVLGEKLHKSEVLHEQLHRQNERLAHVLEG